MNNTVQKTVIGDATLYLGDCIEVMRSLPDNSIDSVVTDPPYGLSFMGKKWDYDVPSFDVWKEVLRVLKPGGHLLSFGGSRTYHRMAVAIEDAGFEIRDTISYYYSSDVTRNAFLDSLSDEQQELFLDAFGRPGSIDYVYGSGFPKSLNISKATDKAAGAEREIVGSVRAGFGNRNGRTDAEDGIMQNSLPENLKQISLTAPATDEAKQWLGWGSALKPAHEPVCLARKPFSGTIANSVLEHGTGGLNIDGCRVPAVSEEDTKTIFRKPAVTGIDTTTGRMQKNKSAVIGTMTDSYKLGRFPANFIHDGSEEVLAGFPETKDGVAVRHRSAGNNIFSDKTKPPMNDIGYGSSGSAARFFYCAKASKADRDEGLEGMPDKLPVFGNESGDGLDRGISNTRQDMPRKNFHPTVKPSNLMRYLCRLITPPGGVVLDCFMGSGSTGKGAMLEGFKFVGIEREAEYFEIAEKRISAAQQQPRMDFEAL